MRQLSLDLTHGEQLELPWSVADIEQEIACFLAETDALITQMKRDLASR